MEYKRLSKFLSLILRHRPEAIGISLDAHGWARVDDLIRGIRNIGMELDLQVLEYIVMENDKKRFSFSADGKRIRANHGHSVPVDVELEERIPPEILYHGTVEQNSASIWEKGLLRGKRLYVHLSTDVETARRVASRRKGRPVIYAVSAGRMQSDGYVFYQSVNGIWLTEHVPPEYLRQEDAGAEQAGFPHRKARGR